MGAIPVQMLRLLVLRVEFVRLAAVWLGLPLKEGRKSGHTCIKTLATFLIRKPRMGIIDLSLSRYRSLTSMGLGGGMLRSLAVS